MGYSDGAPGDGAVDADPDELGASLGVQHQAQERDDEDKLEPAGNVEVYWVG